MFNVLSTFPEYQENMSNDTSHIYWAFVIIIILSFIRQNETKGSIY